MPVERAPAPASATWPALTEADLLYLFPRDGCARALLGYVKLIALRLSTRPLVVPVDTETLAKMSGYDERTVRRAKQRIRAAGVNVTHGQRVSRRGRRKPDEACLWHLDRRAVTRLRFEDRRRADDGARPGGHERPALRVLETPEERRPKVVSALPGSARALEAARAGPPTAEPVAPATVQTVQDEPAPLAPATPAGRRPLERDDGTGEPVTLPLEAAGNAPEPPAALAAAVATLRTVLEGNPGTEEGDAPRARLLREAARLEWRANRGESGPAALTWRMAALWLLSFELEPDARADELAGDELEAARRQRLERELALEAGAYLPHGGRSRRPGAEDPDEDPPEDPDEWRD